MAIQGQNIPRIQGLAMNRHKTPTTWEMYGLVKKIPYIKLPTTLE